MGLRISLKEAYRRIREAKTLADIEVLFRDAFGDGVFAVDESEEAEAFRAVLGVGQDYPIFLTKAAKGTNPHFMQGGAYTKNCQRCIAVFEMRRRGYAVIALPKIWPAIQDGIYSSQNCFKDPIIKGRRGGRSQPVLDRDALLHQLQLLPNGARAAICWTRPGAGRKGHTVACEKQNGVIIFVDPQSGNMGNSILGEADSNGYSFFRMDNLDFNEQKLAFIAERENP